MREFLTFIIKEISIPKYAPYIFMIVFNRPDWCATLRRFDAEVPFTEQQPHNFVGEEL